MNKNILAFTIADKENKPYADMMIKTFHNFHPDIEVRLITGDTLETYKRAYDKFFYRATPLVASDLFKEGYSLILKLDADQLILGDLEYVFKSEYDVGTVLNINRVDPKYYPLPVLSGVAPNEYYNCGFVAMRSKAFVEHWKDLCGSKYFERFQYGEQDLLNLICHYALYKVRCFDYYDYVNDYFAWHGLVAKGENNRMILRDGKVILPIGEDKYPDKELEIKAYHWAGGKGEAGKMNYRIAFNDDIVTFIDSMLEKTYENKKRKK